MMFTDMIKSIMIEVNIMIQSIMIRHRKSFGIMILVSI